MAEEAEGLDFGAEASAVGVDPAAISIALGAAAQNERVAAKAKAYLEEQCLLTKKQSHLVDLQAQELAHELKLRHWSLWVRHASSVLKLTLELGVGLLLLALVAGLSVMVWTAAHADGLVIESFSVPPDMASRGLTGQVVASQLLDRMTGLVNANSTLRAAKSFANSWGDDIKVEIPDTGVSIGEAYRFLKSWLGHETHINGEVWRTQSGIAMTARVGGSGGVTLAGNEADLDVSVQKMAEKIFATTQPYRYGIYLDTHDRAAEAMLVFKALATTGPLPERVWGYIGWYNALADTAPIAVRARLLERALVLQPDNLLAINNLAATKAVAGQQEAAFRLENRLQSALRDNNAELIDTARLPGLRKQAQASRDALLGAFREASQETADVIGSGYVNVSSASFIQARSEAQAHDLAAARATMADPAPSAGLAPGAGLESGFFSRLTIKSEAGDWAGILSDARGLESLQQKYPGVRDAVMAGDVPLIAYAQARLGEFSAAERGIAATPGDCGPCLQTRARIAELQGQTARADWWFARAEAIAPSLPFAHAAWGRALLERGQPGAAIEKFKLANQKGPHFADPLEMWGEALMAKNQSHLALEKFAEAEKYAPNWGRLHLKWGEALVYAGKRDEARAQFARAAALDLTPSEKSELARSHAVATNP